MLDFVDIAAGVVIGLYIRFWWQLLSGLFRKKAPPLPPPPPRDVGDLVMNGVTELPVLLLEKLTHGKFRGCYITPYADQMGAIVDEKPIKELKHFLVLSVEDRSMWRDYPYPLSDEEHRNYAKAMLTNKEQ